MTDDSPFTVPAHIERLHPYEPGKPLAELERELGIVNAVKMASNENPLGPSPLAIAAARRSLTEANLYPDGSCFPLRVGLGERLGVAPDELLIGAGSNELIHLLVRTFCRPGHDQVVTHANAFLSYTIAARTHGVEAIEAPVGTSLRCDVDALVSSFGPRTRIVFVANPNNPTGAHLGRGELEHILARAPARALVVIDEAYHEYAAALTDDYTDAQPHRASHPGLVVLRTFSKIYGLAGLRIGYGVCHREVSAYVDRVRRPFNVPSVAQAAALAALDDREHRLRSCEAARAGVAALHRGLSALGLHVLPSAGNFVLVDLERDAGQVHQDLLHRGIITRPMGSWGLPRHLRISMGSAAEIDRAVEAMRAVLAA